MATNRTSGNLLGLQIDGEFIACEMSCDFNFETELLDASPIDAGRWKAYLQGARSWSISLNAGLLMRMVGAGLPTVLNAFLTGETMNITFRTKLNDEIPNLIISGQVHVQNGGISSSVNTLATWNVTLQGNGAFTVGINTNVVFGISTVLDDSEVLQDGNNNIIVSENGN